MTNAGQSGSGITWNGVSTLAASTSGEAYKTGTTGTLSNDTYVINLHTPEFMAGLDAGITFDSLALKFKGYNSSGTGGTAYLYLTQNGIKRTEVSMTDLTNTAFRTYSGNASYWGLTGTEATIISELASGAIKAHYWIDLPPSVGYNVRLNSFQVQLEYTLPDTKRAALVQAVA